ncbi:Mitochondrial small ribosomal subunit Rsm22 [compost metagenome]
MEASILDALMRYKLDFKKSKDLAGCVQELSDFFIESPDGATPWNEGWAQIAYLCYYLPLNYARVSSLLDEANARGFFNGLEDVYDFGAGLATASMALAEKQNLRCHLIEVAEQPKTLIENHFKNFQPYQWLKSMNKSEVRDGKKSLALFSYSLTELTDLPDWAYQCEALMIIEPSTQQDGRKLLELREKLLKKGYHVWAPCTHEGPCPLLHQSKTDWCHDRLHFQAPEWFMKMEEHLPMKNRTLTMSYLLMRKTKATPVKAARIVGDRLKEKGKDRQMVCRGTDREFLAWMHKLGLQQEIPRGVLVDIPEGSQKVSNEIRVTAEIPVHSFPKT